MLNILDYPFDSELILRKKVKIKKELLSDSSRVFIEKRIAILGGSTTDEIKNILEIFLLNFGIKPVFYESEYNKYFEDGLFDNPQLVQFEPEIIYIHTSSRNISKWPQVIDSDKQVEDKLEAEYNRMKMLWDHLIDKYGCIIIQNNNELPFYRNFGNQDACHFQGRINFVNRLNEHFYQYSREHENFYIHDINYESSNYGLKEWSNPFYWDMYKYALCINAIPYTSYGVALIVKSLLGKNKKVLALDLDNTLWGGVIGDDGAENIEIGQETSLGQAYAEFQKYVKEQRDKGILLTVISKNDESVARGGFERPDSVLKYDDFASFRANWDTKDRNLVEEANELNLLTESFVFVDDNPAEREIIRQSLVGVSVPEIGEIESYIKTLDEAGYFETTKLSDDDFKRNDMYIANIKRNKQRECFADYGDYLKSLDMVAEIGHFVDIYYSRIAQLTNKSNQFNLTTKRCSQIEIQKMAENENYITLYGKLSDKFGDNGVVSVVAGHIDDKVLHIELWLMSCRVLKRDMEIAMMDELIATCMDKGIEYIYGYYYPTSKNGMVRDFYLQQGFEKKSEDDSGNTVWEKRVSDDNRKTKYIKIIRK
ncbi:HAD-IIIC family phosphatase [Pseudobutyrivibrio ruminis]|uniref:HAD-IIIC family phosphatase n=1 Tax=Pseudobutyrivibrio ruminis TaxID=46206 RepID=UPI0004243665|nr:HAD-IIIC family phosphatase [Pseudobutyrivibrio ruminis]